VIGFDLDEFDEPGIESLPGDITDGSAVDGAISRADVVAHIGAIGDVYLAGENPTLAATVNVVGTSNIAEAAIRHGSRVVYASTWEVYGEPEYQPIDERHPTMPDHPYSITKLAGESLLLAATRLRGLKSVALRLGTAYGSGLRPNSVFRIFLDKARAGEAITIQGDGLQGRQFTHAADIARAFALAARSELSGEAFNIVAPETVTIKELAELVVSHFPTELTFGPPRSGDVPPARVSAEKAMERLEWTAEVPFGAGLEEFISGASESW
jgi:UDP-glucose 4-epimerase